MDADISRDDLAERLAAHLEAFSETLDERDRLLLHRMIWLHLDSADRMRFGVRSVQFSDEQEAIVRELEQQAGK